VILGIALGGFIAKQGGGGYFKLRLWIFCKTGEIRYFKFDNWE